jgi:adenylate kinase
MAEERKIIVLLGPPGCGKGTQAKLIAKAFSIPQISTGDMLREERSAGTELGRRSSVFMDKGELVPDELILDMVKFRIQKGDCAGGFILDGFPRTLAQATALDETLEGLDLGLWRVLYFDVPDAEIIERITGRLSCVLCGKIYHVTFNPPPTRDNCECGGYLLQRPDDSEAVVTERLRVYKENTAPVIGYYEGKGRFTKIRGGGKTIEEVNRQVMDVLRQGEGR